MRYTFEITYPTLGGDKELLEATAESVEQAAAFILAHLRAYDPTCAPMLRLVARVDEKPPILSDSEKSAINALDPALTPLCVSFVGMQQAARAFGLYNIEEAIDENLPLHSTVSLQTITAYGYRPVGVSHAA